jgi:hypothetical protein
VLAVKMAADVRTALETTRPGLETRYMSLGGGIER